MIYYKTEEEIQLIRESCQIVGKALGEVSKIIEPGITTNEIDEVVETFIRDHGAEPAFKNYQGFPKSACTSVNEQVVHGIPDERELKEGDIISVDIGAVKEGFYGDFAYTFPVGDIDEEVKKLLEVTKTSLYKGIEQSVVGNRIGDIGSTIQNYVEVEHPYKVVRDLVGHGVGKELHEDPEVPNYGKRGQGTQLKEGLVIAIEPMVNMERKEVVMAEDGWTIITADRKPSAHFEHNVAIGKHEAELLSTYKFIEHEKEQNPVEQ